MQSVIKRVEESTEHIATALVSFVTYNFVSVEFKARFTVRPICVNVADATQLSNNPSDALTSHVVIKFPPPR